MSENGTQTQEITIQDWAARIPAPFSEGHTLNENQAGAMNQLFAENIRNNFAKRVKDAREKAEKEGGQVDFSSLQVELDAYSAEYEFGTRKGGGGGESGLPKDPIQRAAHMIARGLIRDKAKQKGKKLTPEQVAGLVPLLLEKNPSILEEARRQVEAQAQITIEDLELPEELPSQEQASEQASDPNAPAEEPAADQEENQAGKRSRKRG